MRQYDDVRLALVSIINISRNILDLIIEKRKEGVFGGVERRNIKALEEIIGSSKDIEGCAGFLVNIYKDRMSERDQVSSKCTQRQGKKSYKVKRRYGVKP